MNEFEIRPLTTAAELRTIWPVAQQLRPHLDEDRFVEQALRQTQGTFRATGLYDGGAARAYAGWRVHENLVYGLHMYVDDLVTDQTVRSRGYGKALLDWLKDEARRQRETAIGFGHAPQGCARFLSARRLADRGLPFRDRPVGWASAHRCHPQYRDR
jgi:GNAT superfamily N-acetyltransferase